MKKVVTKVIPLACVITAPFFVHADEQTEASAMLCASSSPSFAASKVGTMPTTQPVNKNDKQVTTNGQITPPAGPLVSNGVDLYITADFIWWKAQQDGLAFAYDGVSASPTTANAPKGTVHQPHFKYEPGFKVGLGILSAHDNWDFLAEYTWLNTPSHATKNTVNSTSSSVLNGVQTQQNSAANQVGFYTYNDSVEGQWKLDFNVLDLELGRNFFISKRLTLRPHAGVKFSWLKQEYNVSGLGAVGAATTFATVNKNQEVKEFGVGLRAGVNTAFYMSNKWSIFADLDWTALWNHFKTSRHDYHQQTTGGTQYTDANVHHHPYTITSVLEMALGIRFETIFSKGKYMYMLQAGWENQVWFNQGQFINFNSPNNPGNLSLEGLTIKTGFYF